MLTLVYSVLALWNVGLAVMVVVVLTARAGYEDSLGFHPAADGAESDSAPISSQTATR